MVDNTSGWEGAPPKGSNSVLTPPALNSPSIFSGEVLPSVPDITGLKEELPATTRFQPGTSGNPKGRPKGARSKLTEVFVKTLADHFVEHGKEALDKLSSDDPATYLAMIRLVIPKALIQKHEEGPDIDPATLTLEEAAHYVQELHQRKMIEKAIERVSK